MFPSCQRRTSWGGGDGGYSLDFDRPESVGRVAAFYGNIAVVIKAYAYLLVMGGKGLYERHLGLGAAMVGFDGWEMPLHYREGILQEHLTTRRAAGLFDVSHMGRLAIRGGEALRFLQRVLSNDASVLPLGKAQYTLIPTPDGGALDDAFLYRFEESEYLLVVNASNREPDLEHFRELLKGFPGAECLDLTKQTGMVSLQGPRAQEILQALLEEGALPELRRGSLSRARGAASELRIARTGYTGEPIGFKLFSDAAGAGRLWDLLLERGAAPTGLGARDSLRLEAGLPLYGHELGADPSGAQIPIFACPQARPAVSFGPQKGDFSGGRPWRGRARLFRDSSAPIPPSSPRCPAW